MTASVVFIDRNFDDVRAMMTEARNYIAYGQMADNGLSAPDMQTQIGYETMRVTARLLSAMAWLLVAKAIRTGEISGDESRDRELTLLPTETCLDPSGPDDESLPKGLRSLLDRSYRLYARVSRLDDLMRHAA